MLLSVSGGLNSFVQFVTVLIIFVFVLFITYATTKWIANFQKAKIYSNNIEVIETYKITTNKFIQIVRTGDKYLAIAVCKDTVTMLTELTEEQIVIPDTEQPITINFKEILEKAKSLKIKK